MLVVRDTLVILMQTAVQEKNAKISEMGMTNVLIRPLIKLKEILAMMILIVE